MTRGKLLLSSKRECIKTHGSLIYGKILERCKPETREVIENPVLKETWYPDRILADFMQAAYDIIGEDLFVRHVRVMAKHHMHGLMQVFLRWFATPRKYAYNSHRLWSRLRTTGNVVVVKAEAKCQVLKVEDYDFLTKAAQLSFGEFRCGVLELIGCHSVVCKYSKKKDGYYFSYSWD